MGRGSNQRPGIRSVCTLTRPHTIASIRASTSDDISTRGSNGSSTFESLWDEYFYGDNSSYYGWSSEEEDWTLCNDQCLSSWVGDSFCDLECDVEECSFDGGDCVTSNATTTGLFDDDGDFQPSCSKGCLPAFQGDFVW